MRPMNGLVLCGFLLSWLAACSASSGGPQAQVAAVLPYDCMFQGVTSTPVVQPPTPTAPAPTATPNPCPTRTPQPTHTPIPLATTNWSHLGESSGRLNRHTLTPDNERLQGVTTSANGGRVLWYRRADSALVVVDPNYPDNRVVVGFADEMRVVFRPDGQYDLFTRRGQQIGWRTGASLMDLPTATELILPWGGADFYAAYGTEGWLHLAASGQVARFNPFTSVWEFSGNYTGAVKQLVGLQSGALLMLTTTGIFRFNGGDWVMTWDVNSIQVIRNPDGPEYPLGLAVYGDNVAIAWDVPQGFGADGKFDFTEWRMERSSDGGQTWGEQETVAVPYARTNPLDRRYTGWYGPAWALYRLDGTLEVTGSYKEVGRGYGTMQDAPLGYPVVVRWTQARGWYPATETDQPQTLTARAEDAQRLGTFLVSSTNGVTLIAYEIREFNGAFDVYSLTR